MRLFLVRHGETPANVLQSIATDAPGPGLTEAGHRQARALPDVFRDVPIDGIWVSTLVRTQLTAAPLVADRNLPAVIVDGLREVEAGALEQRADLPSRQHYNEVAGSWLAGDLERAMPDGPNGYDFLRRYDAAIEQVASAGVETAVVVSHGTAIRHWTGIRVDGVDREFARHTHIPNTGVIEIEGVPGAWSLTSWMERSADWAGAVDGEAEPSVR